MALYATAIDGIVCPKCAKKAGYDTYLEPDINAIQNSTCEQINAIINAKIEKRKRTKWIGLVGFDDVEKTFNFKNISYNYNQVVSAELLEDTDIKSEHHSGIGSAAVGGLLLGPVGAIAGGLSGHKTITKGMCNSIKVQVNFTGLELNVLFIDILVFPTETNSASYNSAIKTARITLAKFQEIIRENEINATPKVAQPSTSSIADELLKYKNLLDMGAISQEEFDKVKNKLLG